MYIEIHIFRLYIYICIDILREREILIFSFYNSRWSFIPFKLIWLVFLMLKGSRFLQEIGYATTEFK